MLALGCGILAGRLCNEASYARADMTEEGLYTLSEGTINILKRAEVPLRVLVHEILEEIDDVVDELEIRQEVEYVHKILEEGTSADRQLAVYHKNRDLRAVVDHVIAETKTGID